MKKFLLILAAAALTLSAGTIPENRINKQGWIPSRSNRAGEVVNINSLEGIIEVVNIGKDANGKNNSTGVSQEIVLKQTQPRTIKVSAECKAEKVAGKKSNDFSVYMDVLCNDGSYIYAQCVQFTPGTHDWEQCEKVFKFPKAVKLIKFYVFLRNNAGKATFRNIRLIER